MSTIQPPRSVRELFYLLGGYMAVTRYVYGPDATHAYEGMRVNMWARRGKITDPKAIRGVVDLAQRRRFEALDAGDRERAALLGTIDAGFVTDLNVEARVTKPNRPVLGKRRGTKPHGMGLTD